MPDYKRGNYCGTERNLWQSVKTETMYEKNYCSWIIGGEIIEHVLEICGGGWKYLRNMWQVLIDMFRKHKGGFI